MQRLHLAMHMQSMQALKGTGTVFFHALSGRYTDEIRSSDYPPLLDKQSWIRWISPIGLEIIADIINQFLKEAITLSFFSTELSI